MIILCSRERDWLCCRDRHHLAVRRQVRVCTLNMFQDKYINKCLSLNVRHGLVGVIYLVYAESSDRNTQHVA